MFIFQVMLIENEKVKLYQLISQITRKKSFLDTSFENLIMLKPNMMTLKMKVLSKSQILKFNQKRILLNVYSIF